MAASPSSLPPQPPLAKACVCTTETGPCGAWSAARQRPTLSCDKVGVPLTVVSMFILIHCTVTQGCGTVPTPTGSWNGQPAMVKVSVAKASGAVAFALVLDETIVTVPPCGHWREEATVRRAAAIASPSLYIT